MNQRFVGACPLAMSVGDPSGIGPEIAIAAWPQRARFSLPPFRFLADPDLIESRARFVNLPIGVKRTTPSQATAEFASALPVVPLDKSFVKAPGHADRANAAGVIEAIRRAAADVVSGAAAR